MAGGVVQLDELAVFDERARNPDMLPKALGDSLGKRRLAVARRAVQEHARARVHRRAERIEQIGLDADPAERGRQLLAPRRLGTNRLRFDRHHVIVQRHRHRPHVRAGLHRRAGTRDALFRERIAIIVECRLALVHEHLPGTQREEHVFQDSERQTQPLGDIAAARRADLQQVLANQRLDDDRTDARLIERLRLSRLEHVVGKERRQQTGLTNFGMTCGHSAQRIHVGTSAASASARSRTTEI